MSRFVTAFAVGLFFTTLLHSQCEPKHDFRSDKNRGVLVGDVVITGTRALDSAELADISTNFSGSCFNDSSDEIRERLKDQFQQHGFFMAKVSSVRLKAPDPLANPRPVSIEAEVQEGPRYRLGELVVAGNRFINSQRIADAYPLKPGAAFDTSKVRSGLESVRKLYGSEGYLDVMAMPEVTLGSNAVVTLRISITEGKQYRMGKLEIGGDTEKADLLRARWEVPEGATYDDSYLAKFIEVNRSLLPSDFGTQSVGISRNCRENKVTVHIHLGGASAASPTTAEEELGCEQRP